MLAGTIKVNVPLNCNQLVVPFKELGRDRRIWHDNTSEKSERCIKHVNIRAGLCSQNDNREYNSNQAKEEEYYLYPC